jgi:two-component system sensor histidine kinase and response regulator WspE
LELFRAELDSHLPALTEGLLALEKSGSDPKLLEGMMRAAHSLKGAARIVGIEPTVKLAHVLEDCFVAAQKGQVTLGPESVDVLLRGVDLLGQVSRAAEGDQVAPGVVDALAGEILAVRQGRAAPRPGAAPPVTPVAAPPPAPPPPAPPPGPDPVVLPDLTAEGAGALRDILLAPRESGGGPLQLDCREVHHLDPTSLAVLDLHARKGGQVKLVAASADLLRALRLAGLGDAYPPAEASRG